MEILASDPQYRERFIELSLLWIEKYFTLEKEDEDILYRVEEFINHGAMVYFAVEEEQAIATCMIKPLEDDVWEIGKLATDECYQSKGAGSKVFSACLEYAKKQDAKKIILYSNTLLEPAIHLYEKFGFKEVEVSDSGYSRCNYQAELVVK